MYPDVIVVGAGIIGSAIGYQLSRAGARVTVFDRGAVLGQATQASAGMLLPLTESSGPGPFVDLGLESLRLFEPLSEELRERTGMDVGYRRTGLVRVALNELEAQALHRRQAWQERAGSNPAWLNPERAQEVEPALTPRSHGAFFYPGEHQVTAPALAQACRIAAARLGAVMQSDTNVDALLLVGDRVTGVRAGLETTRAGEVVLANGAWASAWAASLRVDLPVRPVRGQMVALRADAPALRHIIFSDQGYVLSKPDGFTYVGATEEDAGFDPRPTAEGVRRLLSLVPCLVPGLADAMFSHALAGLRPSTPDRLPVLGRIPGWNGVSIAAGHFRNGVLFAPITAVLIADLLQHGRPRIPIDAFDPGRFLVRVA